MRRLALVLALLALAASPAGALAQAGNPFDGQLPPAQPSPEPTVEPVDDPADDDVGRVTLYAIGGALLLSFLGIGWWISRDARRALPPDHRPERERERLREQGPHRHERQAKAKARQKARMQRQARKKSRAKR
jgi:hypothetical protein